MFDAQALLTGTAFIIGNIAISFATITYAHHIFENKKRQKDELEVLKNGLLTMALSMVYSDHIDRDNFNYEEYDGSRLPSLSGCDPVNACMSYIVDSPNPHIHAKYNAIQRFLHLNLHSENDQETFLQEFMNIIQSISNSNSVHEEVEPEPMTELFEDLHDDSNKEKEE